MVGEWEKMVIFYKNLSKRNHLTSVLSPKGVEFFHNQKPDNEKNPPRKGGPNNKRGKTQGGKSLKDAGIIVAGPSAPG